MKTTSRVSADPHPHAGPRSTRRIPPWLLTFPLEYPAGNFPLDFPAIFDYQRVFRYWRDIPRLFTTYLGTGTSRWARTSVAMLCTRSSALWGLPLVRGLIWLMGINRIHWVRINKRRSVHSVLDPQVMVTIDKQGGTKLAKLLFQIAI